MLDHYDFNWTHPRTNIHLQMKTFLLFATLAPLVWAQTDDDLAEEDESKYPVWQTVLLIIGFFVFCLGCCFAYWRTSDMYKIRQVIFFGRALAFQPFCFFVSQVATTLRCIRCVFIVAYTVSRMLCACIFRAFNPKINTNKKMERSNENNFCPLSLLFFHSKHTCACPSGRSNPCFARVH